MEQFCLLALTAAKDPCERDVDPFSSGAMNCSAVPIRI